MATELQQHAEGGNQAEIHDGLVEKELAFNVEAARLEAIYRKLNGDPLLDSSFLHFPSQERLAFTDGDGTPMSEIPPTSGASLIGVDESEFSGKIKTNTGNLQRVLKKIDEAIIASSVQFRFDDGLLGGAEINDPNNAPQRRVFSQFTKEGTGFRGSHEVVGYNVLGPQILSGSASNFTGSSWTKQGDGWTFENPGAKFDTANAVSPATIKTSVTNLQPNRWYKLTYTVSGVDLDAAAQLIGFAASNIELDTKVNKTIYIKSGIAAPGEIILKGIAGTFTIGTIQLQEVRGGNIDVHGKITGGGEEGIKVDGFGHVIADGNISADGGVTAGSDIGGGYLMARGGMSSQFYRAGGNILSINTPVSGTLTNQLNNLMPVNIPGSLLRNNSDSLRIWTCGSFVYPSGVSTASVQLSLMYGSILIWRDTFGSGGASPVTVLWKRRFTFTRLTDTTAFIAEDSQSHFISESLQERNMRELTGLNFITPINLQFYGLFNPIGIIVIQKQLSIDFFPA